ncbi:leucyl aminopeptidase [Cupriavidus necator]
MTLSFSIHVRKPANKLSLPKSDCLVLGLFEEGPMTGVALHVDEATRGLVSRLMKAGDFDGKVGSTLLVPEVSGLDASRLMLVGLGQQKELKEKVYQKAAKEAWRALLQRNLEHVTFTLGEVAVPGCTSDWGVGVATQALRYEAYRFTQTKSKPEEKRSTIKRVVFTATQDSEKAAKVVVKKSIALANGTDLARHLSNLPANVCTPTYLADTAKQMAGEWGIKAEVLGMKQISALKMGAFLAVARASAEEPKLIVLQYRGAGAKEAPVVLVGKGITFDSGGISLKPAEGMDEMKYDMCGAAAVLGTVRAIAEMKLKLNVVAIVPTCENMPGGNALKPGDVVTSMKGVTIEILNTDAEGRLILCDALTYAERFKPAAVVDVATLTGACVIALGHHNSGLFSSDDTLADQLLHASRVASDRAWRMPLDEEYFEQFKSKFADMANVGGRPGGSITAACFLSSFAEAYPWAHLDIAGTAWKGGAAKGATGRPVPLLVQFLVERAEAKQ